MPKKLVFLQTDEDFEQFRRSKLISSPDLNLRVRFNANQNIARFGFIIPKKVLPKVTDRNKVKRRLKTILQKFVQNIKPADLLFFPRKGALVKPFDQLEALTVELIKQTRLWKS